MMKESSPLIAIMGEVLWHSLTVDPTIDEVSRQHLQSIKKIINEHYKLKNIKRPIRVLEVAAYAHTTGYLLAQEMNAEVVLADISADTLALGRKSAGQGLGDSPAVKRVAADFHELPFDDGVFDIVYISSALHHTWRWQAVLNEMLRVIVPGGLLYLENEPCLREFCFYKFRTNRIEQFRPVETMLKDDGLIQTVAEPYLGSRPEELFGMVENQTMPLDEILDILLKSGDIVKKVLRSEGCMSELEHEIVDMRHKGKKAVQSHISDVLMAGVKNAGSLLGESEIALGYALPDKNEIISMAESVAEKIAELGTDESTEIFKGGLARLFGAAVTILLEKHGKVPENLPSPDLRYDCGERDGVVIAYPDSVEAVLNRIEDVLPDIQIGAEHDIKKTYPTDDWVISVNDNGIRTLSPLVNGSRILCGEVPGAKSLQILVRVYAHFEDAPYRVHLALNGVDLDVFDVYQIDSFLFSVEVTDVPVSNFELSLSVTVIGSEELYSGALPINISGARLCAI